MADQRSDLDKSKLGVAVLATCIAQTLNESDPTFQSRFMERLERAWYALQNRGLGDDNPYADDNSQAMALVTQTRILLSGYERTAAETGRQGKAFLED
jgi:hypothetical protein